MSTAPLDACSSSPLQLREAEITEKAREARSLAVGARTGEEGAGDAKGRIIGRQRNERNRRESREKKKKKKKKKKTSSGVEGRSKVECTMPEKRREQESKRERE